MFTLGIFYFIFYITIIISLFAISFLKFPTIALTQWSTSNFFFFLTKYTKYRNIFFFLLFSLTGLPPVGLFFVKLNILTFLFYQTHVFVIIFVFITFFLNMLYYTQVFNLKNYKKKNYELFNNIKFNEKLMFINKFDNYITYKIFYFLISVCFFLFFSLLIYTDIFLIILI